MGVPEKRQRLEDASDAVPKKRPRKRPMCERCPADKPKRPNYGFLGDKSATRCKAHIDPGMVDLVNLRCDRCPENKSKRPSYGLAGDSPTRCKEHANEGMVDLVNPRCDRCPEDKPKRPNYGMPGHKRATRCKDHADEGMIDIKNKRCELCPDDGTGKQPCFGMPGYRPTRCKEHADEGMVDIKNPRCQWTCCTPFSKFEREFAHFRHPTTRQWMCTSAARNCVVDAILSLNIDEVDRLNKHFGFNTTLIVRQEHAVYHALNKLVPELRSMPRCLDTPVKSGLASKAKSMGDSRPDAFHKWPPTNMALHIEVDETPYHEDCHERLAEISAQADTFGRTYVIRIQCNTATSNALCRLVKHGEHRYYKLTDHGNEVIARVAARIRTTLEWMKQGLVPNDAQGRSHVVYI